MTGCAYYLSDNMQGRRKSGIVECPICEEEKGKRLECSDDGTSCIVYYYGNSTLGKTEQCSPMKEEPRKEALDTSPPPLEATVIYYNQTSLE